MYAYTMVRFFLLKESATGPGRLFGQGLGSRVFERRTCGLQGAGVEVSSYFQGSMWTKLTQNRWVCGIRYRCGTLKTLLQSYSDLKLAFSKILQVHTTPPSPSSTTQMLAPNIFTSLRNATVSEKPLNLPDPQRIIHNLKSPYNPLRPPKDGGGWCPRQGPFGESVALPAGRKVAGCLMAPCGLCADLII